MAIRDFGRDQGFLGGKTDFVRFLDKVSKGKKHEIFTSVTDDKSKIEYAEASFEKKSATAIRMTRSSQF